MQAIYKKYENYNGQIRDSVQYLCGIIDKHLTELQEKKVIEQRNFIEASTPKFIRCGFLSLHKKELSYQERCDLAIKQLSYSPLSFWKFYKKVDFIEDKIERLTKLKDAITKCESSTVILTQDEILLIFG